MDTTVLNTLEYDKILERLAGHTLSGLGRELAERLRPLTIPSAVGAALMETTEARAIIDAGAQIPLWGLGDLRPLLERAEKGGILSAAELTRLGDCLRGCAEFRRYMHSKQAHAPGLYRLALGLVPLRELENEIYAATDGARVADQASPRLARVRRDLRIVEERIKAKLQSFLSSTQYRDVLQDSFVTMRDGRYCLPVKVSHRAKLDGLVVDGSGSGLTVYVEPAAIRKLTDELRILKGQEEAEEFQVLTALTGLVAEQAIAIGSNLDIMARCDLAFAKGRLSSAMGARTVSVRSDGFIQLLGARHPLVAGEVVPVDLMLGRRYRTLIITGPNTGGKTVALKTVGLLTLMAQSGLHIPVAEGSIVSVFAQVLADIGDAQDIEQSLSTFSGHMRQIAQILRQAGPDSLILLDEIGTGTDPAEGAALAMGILEELHTTGAVTLATTHYSDVKRLGDEHPGFINGRMDFDRETLKPLYRLVVGEAGQSQAFWIAAKLGVSERALARARRYSPAEGGPAAGSGTGSGTAAAEHSPLKRPEQRVQADVAGPEGAGAAPEAAVEVQTPSGARIWRLGDSVEIEPGARQAVIVVLPDQRGDLVVLCRGQRESVPGRRAKLLIGAEHLYPEGYDLRTVLFTWQERHAIHDAQRKGDKIISGSSSTKWLETKAVDVDRRER